MDHNDADEQAVAFPIGPDFGLGVAIGHRWGPVSRVTVKST